MGTLSTLTVDSNGSKKSGLCDTAYLESWLYLFKMDLP